MDISASIKKREGDANLSWSPDRTNAVGGSIYIIIPISK
jgi:hypothetical protein